MQLPTLWMKDNTQEIKHRDFMSMCISHPLPNAGAISPTTQLFLFFLALFILLICWHLTLWNRTCWQLHSVPPPTPNSWSAKVMLSKRSFLHVLLPSHSFKTHAIKIVPSKRELQISKISFLLRRMGGVMREGLTDGFDNKAQLTEVVKVCEPRTSSEPETGGICLKFFISLKCILSWTLVHLYSDAVEWCNKNVWNCSI